MVAPNVITESEKLINVAKFLTELQLTDILVNLSNEELSLMYDHLYSKKREIDTCIAAIAHAQIEKRAAENSA